MHLILRLEVSQLSKPQVSEFGTTLAIRRERSTNTSDGIKYNTTKTNSQEDRTFPADFIQQVFIKFKCIVVEMSILFYPTLNLENKSKRRLRKIVFDAYDTNRIEKLSSFILEFKNDSSDTILWQTQKAVAHQKRNINNIKIFALVILHTLNATKPCRLYTGKYKGASVSEEFLDLNDFLVDEFDRSYLQNILYVVK